MENTLINVETVITVNVANARKYVEKRIKELFPKRSFMQSNRFLMGISEGAFPDIVDNTIVRSSAYFIYIRFVVPLGATGNSGNLYHEVNRALIKKFSNEEEFITNVDTAIKDLVKTLKSEKVAIEKDLKKYFDFIDSIK
jgi:hypothetical protein